MYCAPSTLLHLALIQMEVLMEISSLVPSSCLQIENLYHLFILMASIYDQPRCARAAYSTRNLEVARGSPQDARITTSAPSSHPHGKSVRALEALQKILAPA